MFYFDNFKNITNESKQQKKKWKLITKNEVYELNEKLDIKNINLKFGQRYFILSENQCYNVSFRYIVKEKKFEELFFFQGELGAIVSGNKTTFRVWSPTAYTISLFDVENKTYISMKRQSLGVFEVVFNQNMHGFKYKYVVEHDKKVCVIDPYAKNSGTDQSYSIVVDEQHFEVLNFCQPKSFEQLLIYEVHVRDFSSDEKCNFKYRHKFLALTESPTNSYGLKVGFAHLQKMKISHLQLLPIFDFASVSDHDHITYNWGYDPAQHSVIKRRYGSDLQDEFSAINDLRRVIKFYHQHQIGINMDVVYNHVYDHKTFSLNLILPYYFVRLDKNRQVSNGSFCGNDFESATKMGRKYIVDSLKFLTRFYCFDGFRFDLMGIHDLETMQEIAKELKRINPHILLYGEGWTLPTFYSQKKLATIKNAHHLKEFAFFNDYVRDLIKGKFNDYFSKGLVDHRDAKTLNLLLAKKNILEFEQSINYVSCHDNHTLYDRLLLSSHDDVKFRAIYALSIVILLRGIPFLHAGCEFHRTKFGAENSYRDSDFVNMIDWDLASVNKNSVKHVLNMIEFRQKGDIYKQK